MDINNLNEIISRGEDSCTQFKENIHNVDSLATEIVAFSNTEGGMLFIGIEDKTWSVKGLSKGDVERINQLISNASTQSVRPAVNPITKNIHHPNGLVMVVTIPKGISKPYMDNNGVIWVKNGSDKRKVTSREELQRLFQSASLVHADETPANGLTIKDIDIRFFESFFKKQFDENLEDQENSLETILNNMNLANGEEFNLTGALLFAKKPYYKLPVFIIKAIAFPGNEIDIDNYIDSRDIQGTLLEMFQEALSFITINIRHKQYNQNVNSLGIPEIPRATLEELIANALIHRDYFVSAPIRIFVFQNRVEIISPGHLPNKLTIENIKAGNSNIRNPILASFATKLLPYPGLGSGIRRALSAHPAIDFIDDREANLFKVIIHK